MNADIPKTALLQELGYGPPFQPLLDCLADAGLTHAGKQRISLAKRDEAAALLEQHFVRVCGRGDCQAGAAGLGDTRRIAAAASPAHCVVCGGAALAPAARRMREACARAGWTHICVVGGSPNARREIQLTHTAPPEIRLVDGTIARTRKQAQGDLEWADHVVLWGSTQLDHKVSGLYSASPLCTTVNRRSVQELWAHLAESATRAVIR